MDASEYAGPPSVETLYGDHHDWLQGWLRRRLGNAVDAADLAHDAFVRLMVAPRRFGSRPEARVYLRAMAGGLCVDLWRRRQIEQAWLDVLATRPEELAPSAEHQAMVLQALQQIDALLRRLPSRTAEAFVMAVGCRMTDKEVAAELGVSTRMVHKYVAQVMAHCLRLELREAARVSLATAGAASVVGALAVVEAVAAPAAAPAVASVAVAAPAAGEPSARR